MLVLGSVFNVRAEPNLVCERADSGDHRDAHVLMLVVLYWEGESSARVILGL